MAPGKTPVLRGPALAAGVALAWILTANPSVAASPLSPPPPPPPHPAFITETDEPPWTDCLWGGGGHVSRRCPLHPDARGRRRGRRRARTVRDSHAPSLSFPVPERTPAPPPITAPTISQSTAPTTSGAVPSPMPGPAPALRHWWEDPQIIKAHQHHFETQNPDRFPMPPVFRCSSRGCQITVGVILTAIGIGILTTGKEPEDQRPSPRPVPPPPDPSRRARAI